MEMTNSDSDSDNSATSPSLSEFVENLMDGNHSEPSDLDEVLDDIVLSETPMWPPTDQLVSDTQESEREYWELQKQQQDVSDYQQSSTSEGVSELSTESLEKSDYEDLVAEISIHEEDLVPTDDTQCQFSLERRSDVVSDKNRIVRAECQPAKVYTLHYQQEAPVDNDSMQINEISIGARVAVEPDQVSSSTQHLFQPNAQWEQTFRNQIVQNDKGAESEKSRKYIHVTRDNRDDFRKIAANIEFLAYTMVYEEERGASRSMEHPEDQPYDQVHTSIQGYIRKVDVPVGEKRKKRPLFRCAYPDCEREGKPFTNKENCKNHVEKDHFRIQFECPQPDCNTCRHSYYKNMMKSNKHKGELMIRCGKSCKNLDEECKKNYAKYGPPFKVTKLSAEVPVCQKRTANH